MCNDFPFPSFWFLGIVTRAVPAPRPVPPISLLCPALLPEGEGIPILLLVLALGVAPGHDLGPLKDGISGVKADNCTGTVLWLGSCFICALHILWETLKWRVKASSFLLQSLISVQLWSCSKAKCGRGEETQGESHCKLIILGIIKWNDSSSYDVKLMDSLPGGAPRCLRW